MAVVKFKSLASSQRLMVKIKFEVTLWSLIAMKYACDNLKVKFS